MVAPDLLLIEVGNALRRKASKGEIAIEHALEGVRRIRRAINLTPVPFAVIERALEMALAMGHPIYDCVYLALAEAHASFLVTNDATFRQLGDRHGHAMLFRDLPLPPEPP